MNKSLLFILFLLLITHLLFADSFVKVQNGSFEIDGNPYFFIGTNLWYGMHLGAPNTGDQERLIRELDFLQNLGVTNLRIMASSDGPENNPWRVVPVLRSSPDNYAEELWQGLDFLLYEMGQRNMKAVVCLSNFWPWTGGMAQYVSWSENSKIIYPPPAENGSWIRYQLYTSRFYNDTKARGFYHSHVVKVISRRNHCSGVAYVDDPTIMSWELANEPRAILRARKYRNWIKQTIELIRNLDKNHLITIGSEGNTSSIWSGNRFHLDHSMEGVDYCTIHFWPENWGWYDPKNAEGTFEYMVNKLDQYLDSHLDDALNLNKPLVFEEFGLARDEGLFNVWSESKERDRFYRNVFERFIREVKSGKSSLCGLNFWSWSGEGRPESSGGFWQAGHDLIGDPPHEKQGWYGVYKSDQSTLTLIKHFNDQLKEIVD